MFAREREKERKNLRKVHLPSRCDKKREREGERVRENSFPPHSSSEVPLAIYFEHEENCYNSPLLSKNKPHGVVVVPFLK